MALTFIKSNKGADMLLVDSHVFRREKTLAGERYVWRCADHKTYKCSSRCQTKDGAFLKRPNDHSHPPDPGRVEARKLVNAVKQRAAITGESTRDLLAAVTSGNSSITVNGKKLQVDNLRKAIRRVRREPKTTNVSQGEELVAPAEYQQLVVESCDAEVISSPVIEITDTSITASSHSAVPNHWFQTVTSPNKGVRMKTRSDERDDVLSLMARLPESRQEDQFDITGKNVAAKLRTLDREQRILAEKLINDVLFEAELGNLTRNRQVVTNIEPTPSLSNQNNADISCV